MFRIFGTGVVRVDVDRVHLAAVSEGQCLQHVVVLAVDDRVIPLVAAAFDLPVLTRPG